MFVVRPTTANLVVEYIGTKPGAGLRPGWRRSEQHNDDVENHAPAVDMLTCMIKKTKEIHKFIIYEIIAPNDTDQK